MIDSTSPNEKVFGILFSHPKQEAVVKAHCLGDCAKLSVAGAIITNIGPLMVCCEKVCPHLGVEMDEPYGTSTFHGAGGAVVYDVYLRVLKTEDHA